MASVNPANLQALTPEEGGHTTPDKPADDMGVSRDRYLAMLSHDLRSAISSVIGGLDQIDAAALTGSDQRSLYGIKLAALDAVHILDGVIDLQAIDENAFQAHLEPTDLSQFLSDLLRRWQGRAASKRIALMIEAASGMPADVDIDRSRLSRILGNIVENAIKYTDEGAVRLDVSKTPAGELAFRVSDTGPGFSPEALETLFHFKGRPSSSAKPGTGLGLYIARTLVEHLDGAIAVSNRSDGQGAVVSVTVPMASSVPTTVAPAFTAHPGADLPDLSNLHILLAEDNLTNQMVVTQMLSTMNASYVVASDGVEALDKFETGAFDLLVLDIEMPRMSGLEVIKSVRARSDAAAKTPIVALTAYAMREHRERIMGAGANGIIAKPILGLGEFGAELQRHASARQPENADPEGTPDATPGASIDPETFVALKQSIGPDLMEELMEKVAIDLKNVRTELETGLSTGDAAPIKRGSHVLISVAGAIGAQDTQFAAEELNRAAHSSNWTRIRLLAQSCLTGIDEVLRLASDWDSIRT